MASPRSGVRFIGLLFRPMATQHSAGALGIGQEEEWWNRTRTNGGGEGKTYISTDDDVFIFIATHNTYIIYMYINIISGVGRTRRCL